MLVAGRVAVLNCLGRNEFRSVDSLGSVEIGGAGRPRAITGAAANIITDLPVITQPRKTQHR